MGTCVLWATFGHYGTPHPMLAVSCQIITKSPTKKFVKALRHSLGLKMYLVTFILLALVCKKSDAVKVKVITKLKF